MAADLKKQKIGNHYENKYNKQTPNVCVYGCVWVSKCSFVSIFLGIEVIFSDNYYYSPPSQNTISLVACSLLSSN